MDNRAEVRDFLTTRRAKITPELAGLPVAGQRRPDSPTAHALSLLASWTATQDLGTTAQPT